MKKYELETYETEKGKSPFQEWIDGIKDKTAKRIFEMREHYGAGYRIFYSIIENKIVLLLAGSIKRDQNKAIEQEKKHLADYERRNDHE